MPAYLESRLKKFSVFALNQTTDLPIARMPFYAEVGVRSTLEPPPVPLDERFDDAIRGALNSIDRECVESQQCWDRVVKVLREAVSRMLSEQTRSGFAADVDSAIEFVSRVIRRARQARGGATLLGLDAATMEPLLGSSLRAEAERRGLGLAEPPALVPIAWAHPMGVLATDHAGYLSFDLTCLPDTVNSELQKAVAARRLNPDTTPDTTIWIYPMGREEQRFDALAQGRFAYDAVLLKLQLAEPELPVIFRNFGMLSMQDPDLTDWRLSPGSFATNPGTLIGADGCETVIPANHALHEFNFHQVIGVPAAEVGLPIDAAAAGKVRPGFVNEYRLSFVPIGHSLGEILYSFPLAPGESVNLAVIDWTRRDSALRNETTKLDESLVHELRRDRSITETVRASIEEWQRGGSIMGGQATSAGGALGGSGMGLAAGASNAIGGAYSTTRGSRDIAADTVQKLSDNVVQAATSSRELHSTVVVQSAQAEHESIETRTVVNYNHSHALTILYYEVLRHFRVVTQFVRRRPALLTNIHGGIAYVVPGPPPRHEISWPSIYENRKLLEAALLDDRHKEGFNIVERRVHAARIAEVLGPPPSVPPGPPPPQGPEFRYFVFELRTGGLVPEGDHDIKIYGYIALNDAPWELTLVAGKNEPRLSPPGSFTDKSHIYSFAAKTKDDSPRTIPWGRIEAISIDVHLTDESFRMAFSLLKVTGIDVDGRETVLVEKLCDGSNDLIFDNDHRMVLPTRRPAPRPPPADRSASVEEEAKFKEFTEHLLNRRPHYERALRLGTPPAMRAFELSSLGVGGGASLLEKVENRPLEVLGDYVAYACVDPAWSTKIMDAVEAIELPEVDAVERLVSLPTRGVFAEAKLGHCNASEEIDNTRFWDWQQSPIPHLAPEIAPVQPVTPQAIPPAGLQPTQFPQPLVNIVSPPSAPDPQGMTAALTALATANIFRDMSGLAQVSDLLKKLSDNSVAIAGVAQKAATGRAGESSGGGTGTEETLAPPAASGQKQPAAGVREQTAEQKESQQIDNQNKTLQMAKEQLTPPQQRKIGEKVTQDVLKKAPQGLGFLITFQTAVYGSPIDGSARVAISPFGQRTPGADYEEGTTIGPPSPAQKTTIPETFDVKITNGTVMIQTDHASAPGKVTITAYYSAAPDIFVQVIGSSAYDAATSIFTLKGGRDYQQPNSGKVVVLNVQPKTISKKVIAKTAHGISDELGTEAGGEFIIAAKATGKYGRTSSGENGEEFDVALITGALDIVQSNGAK